MDILKSVRTYTIAIFAAVAFLFISCDSYIFDDEGDCKVTYKIKFCYDMNLKWADAFPSEVKSVNLYAFDSDGVFVKEFVGRGEALSQLGYDIELDLPAGDYKLVAWCGLENEEAEKESFTVIQPVSGTTTIDELMCRLNTHTSPASRSDDGDAVMEYSDTRLFFLYHGYMEVNLPDTQDGQEYVYTMYLTKDTNHIRIILQELSSGEDMDADDYEISIEAANGLMAYDNTLLGDKRVTYMPWSLTADEMGLGTEHVDEGALLYSKGLVADLSVGRMMEYCRDDLMLTIRNKEMQETIIARVPLIQYALLAKEYYEMAYGHAMPGKQGDQEFLDREDEYVMTFFLYNRKWMDAYININSWRVVLHNYDVKG